jgi:dienelactone hydrolase
MRLTVEPTEGSVDEPPAITVTRVPPGATVTLEVRTVDAAGHRWRSATSFRAGEDGVVDPSRDPPVDGPLDGVDPTVPFWAMMFASDDEAPVAFVAPADQLEYVLEARADGEAASERIVRRWMADGVRREPLRGDGFSGPLFLPAGDGAAPAVLVVPASTGVGALEPEAALLASHGYGAFVAGYMQEDGLPPSLREIPVEVLLTASRALAAHGRVHGERIGWVAASVGTQGAFAALALADAPHVRCAVAIAPSSVIWQALPENGRPPKTAAWAHGGQPLPWLPIHGERLLPEIVRHKILERFSRHPRPSALHLRPAYEPSLRDQDAVTQASIPVERINCPLLVVSGDADEMWPASEMAESIIERRRSHAVGSEDRQLRFADAGHFIRPPITPTTIPWSTDLVSGGTAQGNAHAQAAAWTARLEFLAQHLGPPPN